MLGLVHRVFEADGLPNAFGIPEQNLMLFIREIGARCTDWTVAAKCSRRTGLFALVDTFFKSIVHSMTFCLCVLLFYYSPLLSLGLVRSLVQKVPGELLPQPLARC